MRRLLQTWPALGVHRSSCGPARSACAGHMLELTASDGAARTGFLELAGKRLELPAMLMYTKRGSTFNLTPDIAQPLGKGKHVDATQLYAQCSQLATPAVCSVSHPVQPAGHSCCLSCCLTISGPSTLSMACSMSAPTTAILSKHPQGARGFLGLQQDLLIATAFDSLVNNYTKWESKLEAGVRLRIHAGQVLSMRQQHTTPMQAHQVLMFFTVRRHFQAVAQQLPRHHRHLAA